MYFIHINLIYMDKLKEYIKVRNLENIHIIYKLEQLFLV